VQGDTDMARIHGGAVLALYDEVFLLLTKLTVTNLTMLATECRSKGRPMKIACLGEGSQSHLDIHTILDFYGLATNDFQLIQADYPTSATNLLTGDVDAAFFITAVSSPMVRNLCRNPGVRVLPLSDFGAITNRFRGVTLYTLAPGEFGAGHPPEAVFTLSTPAVLMAANQVQRRAVSRLARVLYSHRWELEKQLPFLRIQPLPESFDSLRHPGAEIAFGPGHEGFVKKYSEHFKLLLGLPAAMGALWGLWKNFGRKPEEPPKADSHRDGGAF